MTSPHIDEPTRTDATMHEAARDDVQVPTPDGAETPTQSSHDDARDSVPLHADAYTLTVEQILQRLDLEGVSRPKRRVQEFLQKGLIDARKVKTSRGIIWLANELDTVRFIEELKRKEAIGIATQTFERSAPFNRPAQQQQLSDPASPYAGARDSAAVLEERVTHLEAALTAKSDENEFLREQVRSSNDHVKLWSDRAKELKELLQSQTDNTAPMLAAMASAVEARADARSNAKTDATQFVEAGIPITEGDDRVA